MADLTNTEKLIAEKSVCVVLVQGNNLNGLPIWAYVAVRLIDLEKFMEAQKSGNFDPEECGVIIEAGEGAFPDGETRTKMEKEYGFNHEKMLDITGNASNSDANNS